MTTFKDFLSSNSEDLKMESYSENIISNKLDRDRRKKYEQILKEEYNVTKVEQQAKTFSLKSWLSIAASLLILVGAFYFINSMGSYDIKEVAQAEINELHIMADQTVMRKGEADFDEIRKLANQSYVKEDFVSALDQWRLLEAGQKTNQQDYLYMGICHLKLGNTKKALMQLKKVNDVSAFTLEWNWVIALAYLENGNVEKAKEHLNTLIQKGQYKVAKAREIISLIK